MIYLASPYSHESNLVMEERFTAVCKKCSEMMFRREVVYSPIVHCHPIAVKYALPRSFDFWEKFDTEMIGLASEVTVLMLPGWEESKGIKKEIELAKKLGKKVSYVGV